MQADYPAAFEREMGCTEGEWLRCLPGASGGRPAQIAAGVARITIDQGGLELTWRALPPRRIALMQIPRLAVTFCFDDVADETRQRFMRHFDLYTQRGGG